MLSIKPAPLTSTLIALVTLSAARSALAGNSSSGGGEFFTTEQNPWFIGDKPVTYCVDVGAGLSVSASDAKQRVSEALADWTTTLKIIQPTPTDKYVLDGVPRNMTLQFQEAPCDASTELHFYLGKKDTAGEVAAALQESARYTISFAKQTSFNDLTGRAKGIVWVTADRGADVYNGPRYVDQDFFKDSKVLSNVLMHELGHVFGFQHQSSGPMRPEVPSDSVRFNSLALETSRGYMYQRWAFSQSTDPQAHEACGRLGLRKDVELDLLGVNEADGWFACIRGDRVDGAFQATLRFRKRSSPETTSHTLVIRSTSVRQTQILSPIVGNYLAPTGNNGPWPYPHTFIERSAASFPGTLTGNDKSQPIMVESEDDRVNFTYFRAGDGKAMYFMIQIPEFALALPPTVAEGH